MIIEIKDNKHYEVTMQLKDRIKKESGLTYPELNHQFKMIKLYIERQPIDQRPQNSSIEKYIRIWILDKKVPTT